MYNSQYLSTMTKKGQPQIAGFAFIGIILFGLLSTIFDPLIHGAIAWMYGWSIGDIEIGLMAGQVIGLSPAGGLNLWLFFMLPSIVIYAVYLMVAILKPEFTILSIVMTVWSSITVYVSDAMQAEKALIGDGYSVLQATAITYLIQLVLVVAYYVLLTRFLKQK